MAKKTTLGIEVEYFTIDENGELTPKGNSLYSLSKEYDRLSKMIHEEVSYSMVEMVTKPQRNLKKLESEFLKDISMLIKAGNEKGIKLLPLGCYPGRKKPKLKDKPRYNMQAFLLENFKEYIGRICGFHFHYSLPKGIVEKSTKKVKQLRYSKEKEIFLNQYNFLVASDPACITFTQSSPLAYGKHFAKDCRTILYRDMTIQDKIRGLWSDYPLFGGLPNYEFTLEDIKNTSISRKNTIVDLLHGKGYLTKEITNEVFFSSDLRFMWGPIRVNQVGTIEYRGPDMTLPSIMFSASYLLRLALDIVKEQKLKALPSDIGIKEPFKKEDNTVYLPPFTIVKSMEYLSSRYGFENSSVKDYCSAFFNFVIRNSKKKDMKRLERVQKMLETGKTLSDEILELVEKNGYDPQEVPDEFIRYINLYYSKKLEKEVQERMKLFSK